jgi:uncharacterized protein YbaR (Trm112 family)
MKIKQSNVIIYTRQMNFPFRVIDGLPCLLSLVFNLTEYPKMI